MPASNDLVTLDHAKDWAKRLLKSRQARGEDATLSACQTDVSHMLGHASWHALTRFYQPNEELSTAPTEAPERRTWEESERHMLGVINRQHPGMKATSVEVMSLEPVIEIDSKEQVVELVEQYEDEGGFSPDIVDEALEKLAVPLHAPPGCMWIRVRDDDNKAYLVAMVRSDYNKAQNG